MGYPGSESATYPPDAPLEGDDPDAELDEAQRRAGWGWEGIDEEEGEGEDDPFEDDDDPP